MAVAPIRRSRPLGLLSWMSSAVPNELPFLFLYIIIASTAPMVAGGDLASGGSWISFAVSLTLIVHEPVAADG